MKPFITISLFVLQLLFGSFAAILYSAPKTTILQKSDYSPFAMNAFLPESGIADSIEINRTRFMISRVRLRREGNDTLGECELKSGPFIMEFTPGFSKIFSTSEIPSGLYEKVVFGICKCPPSANRTAPGDPAFADFMTEEHVTVIIEGKVWSAKNPIAAYFIYKSHCTAELEIRFPGLISIDGRSAPKIALLFRPSLVFNAALLLDPRDPENANDIDNSLKLALTAVRK